MPLRLPPLSPLRFFEAAGRLQSFRLAAAELNVTPSAVSHAVVGLERALGVELFVREPRRLTLTPEGADFLPFVSEGLSLIAVGAERLPDRRADRAIRISCAPTLASRWLLPRLGGFSALRPKAQVHVDTTQRQVGFPADGFDFAVRMSRASVAGPTWTRLFGERLVPVCSPACRQALLDADGRADLGRARLIHVAPAGEDWRVWLEKAGLKHEAAEGGLSVDTIQLAFEAAARGLGVALGRRPLVDGDLASGALVDLGLPEVEAETAYWLVGSDGADRRSDLVAFRRWLLAEAAAL
ncbi:transcriptional regulator [Caulobacter sp. CCUG 60055]|uniref:LysR substrate-binding domain-containing protein n=1 Tax=Caulobacter sp. CCUG 60055 TaxID=2100090 RepID=UPI001FA6E27C|nr:LysR substrate-binding domain-containing protein [Caulobacter sp. CCUG 60055]MBQ1542622.1 LysR family transcriptional regulator [Caulobacteraceae bacterium]MCI3179425.1 transcriptional regulator [Caulobacter sp. CCUG 60055]